MVGVTSLITPPTSTRYEDGPTDITTAVSFFRPADALVYAAGDVVSDSTSLLRTLEFPGAAKKNGGSGSIHSARVSYDDNVAAEAFELLVFRDEPVAQQDNVALALFNDDVEKLLTAVRFDGSLVTSLSGASRLTWHQKGFGVSLATTISPAPFICAADSRSLWGLLVCRVGHTPSASTRIYVELGIRQD